MSRVDGLEIERKYLLASAPDPAQLRALGGSPRSIEQTYLLPTPAAPVRRVRTVRDGDEVVHLYTEKRDVGPGVREEREHTIDEATARRLLEEADPERAPIRKTRWDVPHGQQLLELDVFADPAGLVLLEVELADLAEAVVLPDWVGPARDVTDDPAYLNVEIARRIRAGASRDEHGSESRR